MCPPETPRLPGASSPFPTGSHCSHTWYPVAETPGPSASPQAMPALRGGSPSIPSWRPDGRTRRQAHPLLLGLNGPFHPAPSPNFLCSTQCSPPVGNSSSSSSGTAGREGAQPDQRCPPHPGSKVTLNTHAVPPTPISRAGIPPICHVRRGAHSYPDRSKTPHRDLIKAETCQAGGKTDPLRIKSSAMRNAAWGRRRGPGGSYSHGKHRALFSVIQDETTGI